MLGRKMFERNNSGRDEESCLELREKLGRKGGKKLWRPEEKSEEIRKKEWQKLRRIDERRLEGRKK